jgi:hypothetical protein
MEPRARTDPIRRARARSHTREQDLWADEPPLSLHRDTSGWPSSERTTKFTFVNTAYATILRDGAARRDGSLNFFATRRERVLREGKGTKTRRATLSKKSMPPVRSTKKFTFVNLIGSTLAVA